MVATSFVESEGKSIGEPLRYFWVTHVRNKLDWGLPLSHNMDFSCDAAVMDQIGAWEEGNVQENQIGARCGACMWICTKAATSQRPRPRETFFSKLQSTTESSQQDLGPSFSMELTFWIQQSPMELQESNSMKSLQDGIEVPCTM